MNEISKKIQAISTKVLKKDLINEYKILDGARYFFPGILQNYLMFLSNKKYFRFFTNISQVLLWKSKEFLKESIENIATSDNSFGPTLINYYPLPDIKIDGHCLINKNNTPLSIIILYISYTLYRWARDLNTDYGLYN